MRNYKKEAEWRKQKYVEIRGYIDKEIGERLKEKLQNNQKTISSWIKENAIKYIK